MNAMKKLFALLLAVMMVLSLALPAMAVEDQSFVITIEGSEKNTNTESHKGHTYEAYQVLSGVAAVGDDGRTILSDVKWGTGFPADALLTALQATKGFGEGSANRFSDILHDPQDPNKSASAFATRISEDAFNADDEKLLAHVINNVIVAEKVAPTATTNSTEASATSYTMTVPAGFYAIKDKDNSLVDAEGKPLEDKDYTDIILHVSENVTVKHKGTIPTVTKRVLENASGTPQNAIDAAFETDYYYILSGTLPDDFDDYSEYYYAFHDQLSNGVDFVGIVDVYIPRGEGKEYIHAKSEEHPNGYVLTKSEDNKTITVTLGNLKHDNNAHRLTKNDRIIVVYKAKLNQNAVVGGDGNNNTVCLEYSNNPNGEGHGVTSTDGTKVFSYALELNKYDGKTPTKALGGVEFVLYRNVTKLDASGSSYTEKQYANFTAVAESNVYKINAWVAASGNTVPEDAGVLMTTAENGKFVIHGLDSGKDYYLTEVTPAASYNRIPNDIQFNLTASHDEENVTNVDVTLYSNDAHKPENDAVLYGDNNSTVIGIKLNVPNYQGAVLPSTGGVGTTLFYIIGAVLVVAAIVLLVTKKRMN